MPTLDHSTPEASVSNNPVDSIAELLLAGDDMGDTEAEADDTQEQTPDNLDTEDSDDAEEPSEESTEGEEVDDDESEEADNEEDQTLTEMLGIDDHQLSVSDDGNVMINVKVDGKKSQHSLADVIKNYQLESSNTNKSKSLAEERKAFDDVVTAKAQEVRETLDRNVQLTKMLEQELLADFAKVDWDDLREYDPAEWSAKRQEYSAKYQKVQRLQNELSEQDKGVNEASQKERAEKQQAYLKGQYDVMINNNPSWSDESKLKTDMDRLKSFAGEAYGFKDQDFAQVNDARIIELLKDAQAYRNGAQVAQKKLKKVPKLQKRGKSGRFTKSKTSKLDKLTKAAKSATGGHRRSLQTEAVAELLTGGL